jgi:RNA polymerase sigma-70 factor, ECF subfamily
MYFCGNLGAPCAFYFTRPMEVLWIDSPIVPIEKRAREVVAKAEVQPNEPTELEGHVLVEARRGKRSALEAFVKHYERRLFAFLYRTLGPDPALEDIAQDVFLRAIQALPRFELGKAKLSSWLFQIAVHRLRDELRQRRPGQEISEDTAESSESSPEKGANERETLSFMHRAVGQLPEEQRVALVLFEFHELSLAEIADITSTPEATVKTRIFRAKKKLLDAYQAHSRISDGGSR